jgi:NAD+ diphosphatase
MFEDSIYKRYIPGVIPPTTKNEAAYWFIFNSDKLLTVKLNNMEIIPFVKNLEELGLESVNEQYLGLFDGKHCYSTVTTTENIDLKDMSFGNLRALSDFLDKETYLLAGRALQIVNWDKEHKYCGKCGSITHTKTDERVKVCPKCGFMSYPRISPAIIVAVVKEDELLLAHNIHNKTNMYSIIAGFLEPGETLEECVSREVFEEVGIKVKNVKYFGSQPWPYPNSLMIGFTAEYKSGEINVDGEEIDDAGWYKRDNLPEIPSKLSISRRLIDWFAENY